MKPKQNISKLIWVITIMALGIGVAHATEAPPIQWNEVAQSQVMNSSELAELSAAFPTWKIKQITWPSVTELNSKRVAVDPNLTVSCMGWLAKFMKKGQLPVSLDKKLIPMKEWGVVRKESEQKRLCDVFIARLKKTPYVIHIQESPYNIVIAVADERLADNPRADCKNLAIEIGTSILNEALKPNPDSEELHLFEVVRDGRKIGRVSWSIESVIITDKNGKKALDLPKVWQIGTSHVEAETDGRFVKFDIPKEVKGPRACLDPYVERFSLPE